MISLKNLVCVCVYVHVMIDIGRSGDSFSSSSIWVPKINQGCQTWRQVSFPAEPSCCPPNVAVFKHGFTFLHCEHSSFHSWVFVFCVFLFVYWPLSLGRSKGKSQASEKLLWMEHGQPYKDTVGFPELSTCLFDIVLRDYVNI